MADIKHILINENTYDIMPARVISIEEGGTGATTATDALTNLGIPALVATQITTAIDAIPQADLAQTDTTAKDYVKNKPTSEDIVQMFMEMDVVQPMADENGAVYTDTDGKAFVL